MTVKNVPSSLAVLFLLLTDGDGRIAPTLLIMRDRFKYKSRLIGFWRFGPKNSVVLERLYSYLL